MSPMPVTCPACRAGNDTGPACRRCKADLSLLFALETQRAWHLAAARHAAGLGHWADALVHAERADALRHGPDTQQLRAALYLVRRDFAAAWERGRPGRSGA